MLSLPSRSPGLSGVPQDRQRMRCDEHAVVGAVRLRGSLMRLSTPAAPWGRTTCCGGSDQRFSAWGCLCRFTQPDRTSLAT